MPMARLANGFRSTMSPPTAETYQVASVARFPCAENRLIVMDYRFRCAPGTRAAVHFRKGEPVKNAMCLAICACVCTPVMAQPPSDCTPNAYNIPSAPYPCVFPDSRVTFRVSAPDAQKVRVRLGSGFDMSKGPDGLWFVTTPPQVVGFHYYTLSIDGAVVADPATRTFFGSGCYNSAIEVPEPDADYYTLKDVPHGQVRQRWYYSKVTGSWRRAYVYTPPDYDTNTKAKYPVLYLLHGWGENEEGWHVQGHVDVIMDNLIAAKQAKPMIIVMDNLNAVRPGESAALYAARGVITQAVPPPPQPSGAVPQPAAAREVDRAVAAAAARWPARCSPR